MQSGGNGRHGGGWGEGPFRGHDDWEPHPDRSPRDLIIALLLFPGAMLAIPIVLIMINVLTDNSLH